LKVSIAVAPMESDTGADGADDDNDDDDDFSFLDSSRWFATFH